MLTRRNFAQALIAGTGVIFSSCASSSSSTAALPSSDPKAIDSQMRSSLISEMRPYAKTISMAIDEQHLVYESLDDKVVASVPVVGIEKLKSEDFVNGRDVGLFYTSSAIKAVGKISLLPGVYSARVLGDPNKSGAKAQLIQQGKVAAEGTVQPANVMETAMLSGKRGGFSQEQGETVTTRCYGFILFCRLIYPGGFYSDRWYYCGFCWGFWW